MEVVRLTREGTKRAREQHPWIYSNELEPGFSTLPEGEIVEIRGAENRCLGIGLLSPRSLIAVRRYSLTKESLDRSMLERRIQRAIALRRTWFPKDSVFRLVHGEADDLPGMIIDRYHEVLVVQVLISGVHRLLDVLADVLIETLAPKGILARFDPTYREQEALPTDPTVLYGDVPDKITIRVDGLPFLVDNWKGQKTGFYLDQRPARQLVRAQARGKSVLDLFCYTGAFSIYAAKGDAARVVGLDSSQAALALAEQNAVLNGLESRCEWRHADVFDFLKQEPSEQFDLVLIDPPSLVKSRRQRLSGLRAYRDLNARALQWAKPGGTLLTSSCSGLIDHGEFFQALGEAAVRARRTIRLVERLSQGKDHPIRPDIPQTEYLKAYWFEID